MTEAKMGCDDRVTGAGEVARSEYPQELLLVTVMVSDAREMVTRSGHTSRCR